MSARLHTICERIARLETERKELAKEIADIKKEAKEEGFDAALITKTVRVMTMTPKKRQEALEQHELFDTYLSAVGLLPAFEANVAETKRREETPDHDPETGELEPEAVAVEVVVEKPADLTEAAAKKWTDLVSDLPSAYELEQDPPGGYAAPVPEEAAGADMTVPAAIVSELPDVPAFLDRRRGA